MKILPRSAKSYGSVYRRRWQRICSRLDMASQADDLRARARAFAVRILRFVRTLPHDPAGQTAAHQLARAGTGLSFNYNAAGRSRSRAEFIARLGIVVEEADEAEKWLVVIRDADVTRGAELDWLLDEAAQLRAIFCKASQTARRNHPPRRPR